MDARGRQNLYLVRHAQTALNAAGRLRGLADPPLDDVGEAEAERLAAVLATTGVAVVISSRLERDDGRWSVAEFDRKPPAG